MPPGDWPRPAHAGMHREGRDRTGFAADLGTPTQPGSTFYPEPLGQRSFSALTQWAEQASLRADGWGRGGRRNPQHEFCAIEGNNRMLGPCSAAHHGRPGWSQCSLNARARRHAWLGARQLQANPCTSGTSVSHDLTGPSLPWKSAFEKGNAG